MQTFTLESKDLLSDLDALEHENENLKNNLESLSKNTPIDDTGDSRAKLQKVQADFISLQKQYADLEEKYLSLKLK